MSVKSNSKTFPVLGMSCAGCVSNVEKTLNKQEGVAKAEVNFATKNVRIEYKGNVSSNRLKKALNEVGFDIVIQDDNPEETQNIQLEKELKNLKQRTFWSFILSFPVFVFGMFFMNWVPGQFISFGLSAIVLFWLGKKYFINAFKLAKRKTANMDTLVALSTGIAFFFSTFSLFYPEFWIKRNLDAHVYFEAASIIIVFISFGKYIEEKAKSNTSSAIKALMNLQPKTVIVFDNGVERVLPLTEVNVGMKVVVKPGDNIPVDGVLISGHSFVDESMLTGEPIAIEKFEHEKVFAGTINQKGRFILQAERIGKTTRLGQIIETVQTAQGSKAPVQKMVDNIAKYFVPTILLLSIITFCVWIIFGGESALTHGVLTSVAVLIIACPCALGLATPTAIMVGMGKGAENGILIKDAESLETGNKITTVIFDKTGTITEGKPMVSDVYYNDETLYKMALPAICSIESQSNHPLADSILSFLPEVNLQIENLSSFETIIGKGVKSKFLNHNYLIGNELLLQEEGIIIDDDYRKAKESFSKQGKSLVFACYNEKLLAIFAISDAIKSTSKKAVTTLKKKGIKVYMLTGDHHNAAKYIADKCNIDSFQSSQLPEDKALFVRELQSKGEVVAMVGDGINDTEALAVADLSIAIGDGSDIAMEVANVTILSNDLLAVSKALSLSKFTVNGIKQNLFWAFIYNIIGIPIAAGILYPINGFLLDPMIAGGAMAFSSISVVLNSLRLKNKKL